MEKDKTARSSEGLVKYVDRSLAECVTWADEHGLTAAEVFVKGALLVPPEKSE
jgi:hypothetical protein